MNTARELIKAVRELLRDVVLPEVKSDIARARLQQVMATLRDVDWDEAPLALLRENDALRTLAQRLAIARLPPSAGSLSHHDDLLNENRALRAAIAAHFAWTPAAWDETHAEAARVLADCASDRRGRR
ncbi:MAG: hypothetical protein IT500_09745 [Rubrivivax sp.]|nr:hypothetical protein [Rubrivivax sp.]